MRNELLELLQLEDLQGEAYELAELIGIEAFRKLVDRYGACTSRRRIRWLSLCGMPKSVRNMTERISMPCVKNGS